MLGTKRPVGSNWNWIVDVWGCRGGGTFFTNPPVRCNECWRKRLKGIEKNKDVNEEKFAVRRREHLRMIDVWLALDRNLKTVRARRRGPLESRIARCSTPLRIRHGTSARKVVGTCSLGEGGAHSHSRWRLRRVLPVPDKPREQRAANSYHVLQFIYNDLQWDRETPPEENCVVVPAFGSMRERHCLSYPRRQGQGVVQEIYVEGEGAPNNGTKSQNVIKRRRGKVIVETTYVYAFQ